MKYELIGSNFMFTPIDTVLENRGIGKSIFDVNEKDVEDYNNYDNIDKAYECLMKHIDNDDKIGILWDCDVDGVCSGAAITSYLEDIKRYINLKLYFHNGKQHGLSDDIEINDIDLLIIPDAGTNDVEQCKKLQKEGVDIIILDHHLQEEENPYCILVNNQASKRVKNKNLSGVGVVYKFLKYIDNRLGYNKADDYLDLVALGNIADVMDLKERETRYLCKKGIEIINNPFLQRLIEENSYSLENKYNIMSIGWTIAPLINAVIRSGSQDEKEEVYTAFLSNNYDELTNACKICNRCKSRQSKSVKDGLNKMLLKSTYEEGDKVAIFNSTNVLNNNHGGLVANKLLDKLGVPILVLHDDKKDKELLTGSTRGTDNITKSFKRDLENSGLIEWCIGHDNANGVAIKKDNIEKLKKYLNKLYKDKEVQLGSEYKVDFELDINELEEWFIDELASFEDEFGNGIDEPLIAIKNFRIYQDFVEIKRQNIVFYYDDIRFEKKFATNVLKDKFKKLDGDKIDIICKPKKDIYSGRTKLEIVDMSI